jgi:hypothetical protein
MYVGTVYAKALDPGTGRAADLAGCASTVWQCDAGRAKQKALVWEFGFQCNERYLKWDASAQARLLKLHCSEKLGWTVDKVRAMASTEGCIFKRRLHPPECSKPVQYALLKCTPRGPVHRNTSGASQLKAPHVVEG